MCVEELMRRRDELIEEIRELEDREGVLGQIARGPRGIFSGWPSGMPRTRVNQEIVLLQREDVNEAIDRLDTLCGELMDILDELGLGDESIAA